MAGEIEELQAADVEIEAAIASAATALDDLAAKVAAGQAGTIDPAAVAAVSARLRAASAALNAKVAADDPPPAA